MENHPVLDSTNFIRERWEEFLSFRTDAYAYEFSEDDQLVRKNDFQSFGITEFDDHLELVQDFADKSDFRTFFKQHHAFHQQIKDGYRKHYMLNEMMDFLTDEFGDQLSDKKFIAVLSPFVGSQHLLRDPDENTKASFADVADPIIKNTEFSDEDKSANVHTLFTEMNHAFINPVSKQYDIAASFTDSIWNDGSGYDEYERGVFNEYMTWAVFDLFNEKYFPDLAKKINLNWHFQNDTRGFQYSNLFARNLRAFYLQHGKEKKIKDLYPELLSWTKGIQSNLSKPKLLNDSDTIHVVDGIPNWIEFSFSSPMEKVPAFEVSLQFGRWDQEIVEISEEHQLAWNKEGTKATFRLVLPNKEEYYLLLNWWGIGQPLKSQKGVLLSATSGLIVKGTNEPGK